MGRPKTIDDITLISLIDKYYSDKCGDGSIRIKLPELAAYIAEAGYPSYKVTSLRRNDLARRHIESLEQNSSAAKNAVLVAYQTLDVNTFLNRHTTRASLCAALTERDQYYKRIADTAVQFYQEHKLITTEIDKLNEARNLAQQEMERYKDELDDAKKQIKALKRKAIDLEAVIEKYVGADIAKMLLVNEGIIPFSAGVVSSDVIGKTMITPATDIKSYAVEKTNSEPYADEDYGQDYDGDDLMKDLINNFD